MLRSGLNNPRIAGVALKHLDADGTNSHANDAAEKS